jgi:F-type H+-transporting ATPase subunit gamma
MRSVRNIRQITKAMELIAVTRLRRAQQRVIAARPYSAKLGRMVAEISAHIASNVDENVVAHPLLDIREASRVAIVLITSDRGLCGALNGNVIRAAMQHASQEAAKGRDVAFIAVGRKAINGLKHAPYRCIAEVQATGDYPSMLKTSPIAHAAIESFTSGQIDQAVVAYPKFVSTLRQDPTVIPLLPIIPAEARNTDPNFVPSGRADDQGAFLLEPSADALLSAILPRFVEVQIYQAILEAIASEFSARMVAMRNATDNATELIKSLQLGYNKARQATITREIIEVSSGAAALGK